MKSSNGHRFEVLTMAGSTRRPQNLSVVRRAAFRACASVAVLVLALTIPAVAEAPAPADVTAFSQGQAYERLFQDHIMPGTCGIVLERPRCIADFRTIQALRGSDPTDAGMEAWLANGDSELAVKTWNGMYTPDKTWAENPEFAWWYTAGQISISTSLPLNEATTGYLGHFADVVAAHAGSMPAEFRGLLAPSGSAFERLRPLQAALLKTIPPAPFPDASFAGGVKGDAQLGVYVSTLQELIDNPLALSRPESRAFGLIAVRRLQAINDTYATGASFAAVTAALSGDIPNADDIGTLRESLAHAVSTKWPLARRQAFLLGAGIAQIAYNAAVLRDPQSDAGFRGVAATLPAYAGVSSRVRADIQALQKIPYATNGGDWNAINAAASRATTDIASTP
jgi:hypothetical protein